MEKQKEQLSLFTEEDFKPRNTEQAEPMKAETNPKTQHFFIPWMGNDCVYYIGAGNCAATGEFVDCMDCDDYKSVDGDDIDDEDLEDDD